MPDRVDDDLFFDRRRSLVLIELVAKIGAPIRAMDLDQQFWKADRVRPIRPTERVSRIARHGEVRIETSDGAKPLPR